jgi:4-hydroxybenzoate adenylyltransferase
MNLAHETERLAMLGGWLERPAFVTPERTWTHAQVHMAARRLAFYFHSKGLQPGNHLALALDDSPVWVCAFLACARLGATVVVINPHLGASEHAHIMTKFEPKLALLNEPLAPRFFRSGTQHISANQAQNVINNPAQTALEEVFDCEAPDQQAPLYVQFTSGTTGTPKAVPHRHTDFLVYRDSVAYPMLDLRPHDVLFSASRLFFAYGLGNSLAFPLMTGACAVLLPQRPNAQQALQALAQFKATVMFWVPSGYASLLRQATPKAPATLRLAISAGENLSPHLSERLQKWLGVPLLNQLGSTEAGHAYCGTRASDDPSLSVGRPLPGYQVSVRDPQTGVSLPSHTEGELWLTGPTLPTTDHGQWFRTGDCARSLPNGTLTLHGRLDDIEQVNGIKISPLPIEAALSFDPDVLDVAVIGMMLETGESQLWALVVSACSLDDTFTARLRQQVKSQLAPYTVPHRFIQVEALARTSNGKLQRHLMRRPQWIEHAMASNATQRQPL